MTIIIALLLSCSINLAASADSTKPNLSVLLNPNLDKQVIYTQYGYYLVFDSIRSSSMANYIDSLERIGSLVEDYRNTSLSYDSLSQSFIQSIELAHRLDSTNNLLLSSKDFQIELLNRQFLDSKDMVVDLRMENKNLSKKLKRTRTFRDILIVGAIVLLGGLCTYVVIKSF